MDKTIHGILNVIATIHFEEMKEWAKTQFGLMELHDLMENYEIKRSNN